LYGGCQRKFSHEEVKLYVNDEIWRKYSKFLKQKLKLGINEGSSINCPSPDCDEVIELDPLGVQIFVECDSNHRSCSKCKSIGWHNQQECENVKFYLPYNNVV
jgi:hypothetical protein